MDGFFGCDRELFKNFYAWFIHGYYVSVSLLCCLYTYKVTYVVSFANNSEGVPNEVASE